MSARGHCRADANTKFNSDSELHFHFRFAATAIWETKMTKLKTLSAIAIISTVIATPVFAQEAVAPGDGLQSQSQPVINDRGAYAQPDPSVYEGPLTNKERRNLEDFGISGRDPSRVGGEDAWLNPGG
jgi:hypothetical protein